MVKVGVLGVVWACLAGLGLFWVVLNSRFRGCFFVGFGGFGGGCRDGTVLRLVVFEGMGYLFPGWLACCWSFGLDFCLVRL